MLPDFSGLIKIALVGILGALLLVTALSSQDITINAMDFSLGLRVLDKGYTAIEIPPLGIIRARTHQPPLTFRIALKNINLDRLGELVEAQEPKAIFAELQAVLRRQVLAFLFRTIAVAFAGGLGAGLLIFRRVKPAFLAGLVGFLCFSLAIGAAALTFDETAFREPEFEGIVEVAPWLMGVAEEALVAVQGLDEKLKVISDNLLFLFESLRYLSGGGGTVEGELKILHVSDIHNNPIGVSLAKQLAVSFDVDLIVDTGDLTDYGTPLEADLLRGIEETGRPWIFVPGNHDSPSVIETFQELDNVFVLAEDVLYLEDLDLTVAGVADPAAHSTAMTVPPREEYQEAARRLQEVIEQSQRQPSLIVAHHPHILEEFTSKYCLLLHGHSHRMNIRVVDNSLLVDAGSTGGAGIRGLMTQGELPYSMVLLHCNRRGEGWFATAADVITVNRLDAGFILERQLLRQPIPPYLLEAEPEPEPDEAEEEENGG
jgi:predicted phosphodiesterase